MALYRTLQALSALWREAVLLCCGLGVAAAVALAGQPLAAAALLGLDLGGAAAVLVLTIQGRHLRRQLRWLRVRRALGLGAARLAPLPALSSAAEELLEATESAEAHVRRYLEPARADALQVVQRCVELSRLAARHRQRLSRLDAGALEHSVARTEQQLDETTDPVARRQLEAAMRSLQVQCQVRRDHELSLGRIESELEAARQTLGAVVEAIHHTDQLLATPDARGPGALSARTDLEHRVAALAAAAQEEGGLLCSAT